MKPISCHRKYAITTNFLDTMLEHSVDIGEGETKMDAYRRGLKELDQIAAELRKEHESMTGVQEVTIASQWQKQPSPSTTITTTSAPYEINRKHDELKDLIDDCSTIEQLKEWKEKNPLVPVPVLNHYNSKVETLRIEENNKSMGKKNS